MVLTKTCNLSRKIALKLVHNAALLSAQAASNGSSHLESITENHRHVRSTMI